MRLERSTIAPGVYPDDVAELRTRCFPHWYLQGSHRGTLLYRALDVELAGYLIVQETASAAYVEELAVDPTRRRAGVARCLVMRAAGDLVGRVERITVFPMSGRTSRSRREVFLALGFRPDPGHESLLHAVPHELCATVGGPSVTNPPAARPCPSVPPDD